MSEDQQQIQDIRFTLSNRHYITISFLVAILGWTITMTIWYIRSREVIPLQQKNTYVEEQNKTFQENNKSLTSENYNLRKEVEKLQQALSMALAETDRPSLQSPSSEASVVGAQVPFEWKYKNHTSDQKYILEIRNISTPGSTLERYNVLEPEKQLMHFLITRYGEYIWRIRPGQLSNRNVISQGPPSYYSNFVAYPSVIARIKETNILRVGTNPTFAGYFNFIDHTGILQGFDIDLIRWIAGKLVHILQAKDTLEVRFFEIPWVQLLPKLQNNEVDLIISSMTATKKREVNNPGVRFTQGYYTSHQIFIGLEEGGDCRKDLRGRIVGVSQDTTNEQAAKFLIDQFSFGLNTMYKSYAELYRALEVRMIDYALVDDILVRRFLKKRFFQCGKPLDDELSSFYKEELGVEREEYAIAVVEERGENLRLLINELLASEEGKQILDCLEKKWILSGDTQKIDCIQLSP